MRLDLITTASLKRIIIEKGKIQLISPNSIKRQFLMTLLSHSWTSRGSWSWSWSRWRRRGLRGCATHCSTRCQPMRREPSRRSSGEKQSELPGELRAWDPFLSTDNNMMLSTPETGSTTDPQDHLHICSPNPLFHQSTNPRTTWTSLVWNFHQLRTQTMLRRSVSSSSPGQEHPS